MNDSLEIREAEQDARTVDEITERIAKIEKLVTEHGHAQDYVSAKIAEILGIAPQLPDMEEVSPEPLPSEADK